MSDSQFRPERPNEALTGAMSKRGLTAGKLAELIKVKPRTVQRWCDHGQVPQRQSADAAAGALGSSVDQLWPARFGKRENAVSDKAAVAEWAQVHATRADVPAHRWRHMIKQAQQGIDVLELSGTYLTHLLDLPDQLETKLDEGVRIRVALGNPQGQSCRQRSTEERRNPDYISKKVMTMLDSLTRLDVPTVPVRLHDRTLYTSILRADSQMLITTHIYGQSASKSPVIYLTERTPLFQQYLKHFDSLWDSLDGELGHGNIMGGDKSIYEGELTEQSMARLARSSCPDPSAHPADHPGSQGL